MRWSEATTVEFVKIYLNHECLWNPTHGAYTLKYKREEAYADIVRKFKELSGQNMSVIEVKNKIKTLRTTYCQEVHKILSKSGPDHIYEPSLVWFKEMDRCLKYISHKRQSFFSSNNFQYNNDTTEVESSSHSIWAEEQQDFIESNYEDANPDPLDSQSATDNEYEAVVPDETVSIVKIESTPRSKRVKKKKSKNKPIQTYNVESFSERMSKEDEFDIYGRFIATQLRKMELNRALKTQLAIQNLLSEARLSEN